MTLPNSDCPKLDVSTIITVLVVHNSLPGWVKMNTLRFECAQSCVTEAKTSILSDTP